MARSTPKISSFEKRALMFQGIVAILFGAAAVFWPELTLTTLLFLFASFLLIDSVVVLVKGLVSLSSFPTALLIVLLGLLELGLSLYLLQHPEVTFASFIVILGLSLIIRGAFSFIHAFTHHKDTATVRTLHGLLGALGVVIGVIVLNQPIAGGIAFVWILGLYALITGPIQIALASDLANSKK